MVGNTITIHSVPLYAFNILRYLLEMDVWAPKWKLEFKNTSISRGRFTVTVPSDMHRAFWSFTRDIEEQMLTSGFLPRRYKGRPTVRQRGRADVKTSRRSLTPDGSISAIGVNARFLILEVAHSKREKEALRKAQIYILDTNERIKVVVVVIVDKKPTPRSRIADARKLCAETDTVHVHVVKYVEGSDWCAAKCVVEKLQIFPGPEPKDTFELAWWDIHGGSWKRARVEMGLPADTPRPMCQINFRELWDTARRLSDYEEPDIGPFSTWDPAKESPKPKKRIIPF